MHLVSSLSAPVYELVQPAFLHGVPTAISLRNKKLLVNIKHNYKLNLPAIYFALDIRYWRFRLQFIYCHFQCRCYSWSNSFHRCRYGRPSHWFQNGCNDGRFFLCYCSAICFFFRHWWLYIRMFGSSASFNTQEFGKVDRFFAAA